MIHQPKTTVRCHFARWLMPLALVFTMLLARNAIADDPKTKDHPGYVDGSQFVDLIDPDGRLIEVNINRKLLRLFTGRAVKRQEPIIAEILADLVAVNAVIGEVSKKQDEVKEEMDRIRSKIERDDWDRFVRIREGGEEYSAYIHYEEDDEELIDGLLVIGFHDQGNEMIFVNLAGTIDMERIALLGEHMNLPGLEDLPPMSEIKRQEAEKSAQDENEGEDDDTHARLSLE